MKHEINTDAAAAGAAAGAASFFLSNLKTAMRSQSHMLPGRPGPYRATCSSAGAGGMGRALRSMSFFSNRAACYSSLGYSARCLQLLLPFLSI